MLREGFTSCGYVGKEDGMKIPSSFFCLPAQAKEPLPGEQLAQKLPGSNWLW
jgi:hypothetical protein